MDPVRKKVFDPRRVAAYELWGIIYRSSDRLKLTALGWDLARSLAPEALIFRAMIRNTPAYHSALEWFFQTNLHRATSADVLSYWQQQHRLFLEESDEKILEAGVTTFFQLCHAADIGMATRGRKGQPTRLQLHPDELKAYLFDEKAVTLKVPAAPQCKAKDNRETRVGSGPRLVVPTAASQPFRILISHNLKSNIALHLQELVRLMGIESEVVQRQAGDGFPLAEDMLQALRNCAAAIIIIAAEDCHLNDENRMLINESSIAEIGAAYVNFERRVQLVWNKNIPLPSNLKALPFCELEGDELPNWNLGLQLIKSIKDFEEGFQRKG
jgi:hypothetical protein